MYWATLKLPYQFSSAVHTHPSLCSYSSGSCPFTRRDRHCPYVRVVSDILIILSRSREPRCKYESCESQMFTQSFPRSFSSARLRQRPPRQQAVRAVILFGLSVYVGTCTKARFPRARSDKSWSTLGTPAAVYPSLWIEVETDG